MTCLSLFLKAIFLINLHHALDTNEASPECAKIQRFAAQPCDNRSGVLFVMADIKCRQSF